MKIFHLILFIQLSTFSFSQDFEYVLTTNYSRNVYINDSLLQESSYNYISNFNFTKFYAKDEVLHLKNGKKLKIHFYANSTIFFEEFTEDENTLLSSGLLIVDSINYTLVTSDLIEIDSIGNPLVDVNGKMIFTTDTLYNYVPDGVWFFNTSAFSFSTVSYKKGLKHGEIECKPKSYCIDKKVNLSESTYENGNLISSNEFKLPSRKELEKMIIGQWYHPNSTLDYKFEKKLWVFQKEIPSYTPWDEMYSSKFNKDGTYNGRFSFSCGTGRKKEDYYPQYEWSLNSDNTIKINNVDYDILYITNDNIFLAKKQNIN